MTTVSNTYTINVPSGYTAKVTATRIPEKEQMVNCASVTISQYVNGSLQSFLDRTTEFNSTATIGLSISATPDVYPYTYIDYYLSNGMPHYTTIYLQYTTYYATCVYNISVQYLDGSKKLLVTSPHQVTATSAQGQGTISITANSDWSANTDASWITLGTKTKLASESWKQNYTLAKNYSVKSRTGKITFTQPYTESVEVTIIQEADSTITGRELEISGNNTIAAGGNATYTCNIVYSSDEKEKVTPTWSLSNSTYASIDSNGKLVSKNNTLNDIQINVMAAYTYNGKQVTGTFPVTLSAPVLKSISITGEDHIQKYGQADYHCIGVFSYGADKEVLATWSLQNADSRYVSLASSGTITNKNSTTDPISVTLKASYKEKNAVMDIKLAPDILDTPIVTATRNGLVGKVKVYWSPVKDATHYRVYLNDENTPLCDWTRDTGDYSFIHETTGGGVYYVCAASSSSGAQCSPFGSALGFAMIDRTPAAPDMDVYCTYSSTSSIGYEFKWNDDVYCMMPVIIDVVALDNGSFTGSIGPYTASQISLAGYATGSLDDDGYARSYVKPGVYWRCAYAKSWPSKYPAVYRFYYQYWATALDSFARVSAKTGSSTVNSDEEVQQCNDIVPSELVMPDRNYQKLQFVPPVSAVIASTTFRDRIRVAWPVRYTAQSYTVKRTDSDTGKTIVVAEDLTDDCFIDTNVKSGVEYTYSVTGNSVSSSNLKFVSESVESNVGKLDGTAVNAQTIDLRNGWNWVSFQRLPTSHKVGDVLGTVAFTANDVIQSSTGSSRFNGASWIPSSFTLEYGKLYMVYVSKPVTVTLTGAESSSSTLSVSSGWNWIANPTSTAVTPSQLKHSGGWTAGDCIQGASGSVTYSGSKWIPSTGFTLEPGKGYQIRSAKAGTVSF